MVIPNEATIEAYRVHEGIEKTRYVSASDIPYIFIKNAESHINAPWTGKYPLQDRTVYVYTRAGETLRAVNLRSLAHAQRKIASDYFVNIHPTILLNVRYVHSVNPLLREVSLLLKRELHTIFASRRPFNELREILKAGGVRQPSTSRPTRRGRAPRNRAGA